LRGRTTRALQRRGKHLIATLDDDATLLLHLGMTGQIFAASAPSVRLLNSTGRAALTPERQRERFRPDAHTHLQLRFSDEGEPVFFRDARKFGKVEWLAPGVTSTRLAGLGPDALRASGEHLFDATRKRRTAIKARLLDQTVLAGVGNIYADEALFRAGVRPGRAAQRVTHAECDAIADALRDVLRRAIETGGSSIRDYVQPSGRDGGYQNERMVYARAGQPCQRCGATVRNKTIAQRTSCYCPGCQR
jgi:formamidopyrimidine-DNA glycosylase